MTNKTVLCLILILSLSGCDEPETLLSEVQLSETLLSETMLQESIPHPLDNVVNTTKTSILDSSDTINGAMQSDDDKLDKELTHSDSTNDYVVERILRPNVSQQFVGITPTEVRLAYALPELPYHTVTLPNEITAVNSATWSQGAVLDEALTIKIQSLLNYHHHSVGAVDGRYGQNVTKAIEVFQQKNDLAITGEMNNETWDTITKDEALQNVPVLVHYTLRQEDIDLPYHPRGQQYRSVTEAVAEKFHMSQGLLKQLNPNTKLRAGNTIVVYNPYQPNTIPVYRVVANKAKNLLFAYDKDDNLVASYPTTMGSSYKPSPNGTYKVLNRVIDPTYNRDFSNKNSVLPPGPNNPVGRVWIGISKPSYGIHGSPNPEKISQQKSSGCVRLTNWDALGLFGTIKENAKVEFE